MRTAAAYGVGYSGVAAVVNSEGWRGFGCCFALPCIADVDRASSMLRTIVDAALAWLGLAWLGWAGLGLAWLGLA